jgi:uncharacterized repeat protein (TIGR01451 family)
MTVKKTADNLEVDPGDLIIYTIEYKNIGTGTAALVEITDTIPANTTFVSATVGYTCIVRVCTWVIGEVDPGENGTIEITVRVNAGVGDRELLRNEVTVNYADANHNFYDPIDDHADVRVTPARVGRLMLRSSTPFPKKPPS